MFCCRHFSLLSTILNNVACIEISLRSGVTKLNNIVDNNVGSKTMLHAVLSNPGQVVRVYACTGKGRSANLSQNVEWTFHVKVRFNTIFLPIITEY